MASIEKASVSVPVFLSVVLNLLEEMGLRETPSAESSDFAEADLADATAAWAAVFAKANSCRVLVFLFCLFLAVNKHHSTMHDAKIQQITSARPVAKVFPLPPRSVGLSGWLDSLLVGAAWMAYNSPFVLPMIRVFLAPIAALAYTGDVLLVSNAHSKVPAGTCYVIMCCMKVNISI